ncbi:MAG: hypothetical protein FI718_03595 [SAR202 cluster bacterium]|nr:hypothetical protein [SAR202 cluster bacterium]|tara:strand:+ start:3059 stop:3946 length:888 start_codon:yes stop_codon:yes gene_type:complete
MTNLFNFKHRYAFNFDTIWQNSLVPVRTILFDSIFSRFMRDFVWTKNNLNEIESLARLKVIDDSNNWYIYDIRTVSETQVNFEITLLNLMNVTSRSGGNSISILSGSTKLNEQASSLGFMKIQKYLICSFQSKNINKPDIIVNNNIRKKLSSDGYNIFQLVTSNKDKSDISHTFKYQHWKSLIAKFDKGFNEFVVEENGKLVSWFRIKSDSKVVKVEILAYSRLNRMLIDSVLQMISDFESKSIYILVSIKDIKEERLLSEYGMQVIGKYELYVKWLAEFVHNRKKINSRVVTAS